MSSGLALLELPLEIRLKIYDHLLLSPEPIKIAAQEAVTIGGGESWELQRRPLNSQMLRTSKQILDEAIDRLYGLNVFDCASREGFKLLLHSIGPTNCARIKHAILEWEQLQEFAWSLAKTEYLVATQGLQSLQTASARHRALSGSSLQWRSVKSYERQLCQAALDICEKHPTLKTLAQRQFQRPSRVQNVAATPRVKWRFIASDDDLQYDEVVVDIHTELAILQPAKDEAAESTEPRMIDPF